MCTAIICAVGHYWFLNTLDGAVVDSGILKQSQVNALSLLLTTLFKAALTPCVGTCFAQHLWYLLRGAATPVSLIEKLFVLRTNIFALGDARAVHRAPLLFAMALFVWCLSIITIYPPGALIITLEPSIFIETRNISVMNPGVPSDFNPFMEDEYLQYRCLSRMNRPQCVRSENPDRPPFCFVEYSYEYVCYYYFIMSINLII